MNLLAFAYGFNLFLIITYAISSYEKLSDFKGNLAWMKPHFSNSILKNNVPLALSLLVIFEVLTAITSIIALAYLLINQQTEYLIYANYFNLISLFLMLIAQRFAKDFDGARTIVIYLIPSLIALLVL
nr:DoxX family protein [uncultured Flavobacterium sp.]